MNLLIKAFLLLMISISSTMAADGVAKIIILKGDVKALVNGKLTPLKKGSWLQEGSVVQTADKSFAKLLFIDKSTMNVAPKSEMKIENFPKSEAGIITLMKGQIRSKVTKNYMDMKDKNKSKLFIKTKSAAMGVRGTDFQVNFNPINEATSLITFSGAVAMAKIEAAMAREFKQVFLERVVSSDQAVMVRKGTFAGSSPGLQRATTPVKISPVQLETLKKTEVPGVSKAEGKEPEKKQFRSVLPPGVSAKKFANDGKEADKSLKQALGSNVMQKAKQEVKELAVVFKTPPPEGSVNLATGQIAPTAGGYIDLATAQYIPPPEGSVFDSNAGVFIPPPELGRIDVETGAFVNDHFELHPTDGFIPKDEIVKSGDGRAPASGSDGTNPLMPPQVGPLPTMEGAIPLDGYPSIFTSGADGADGDPLADIDTDEFIEDIEQSHEDSLNNPDQSTTTRTSFDLNIQ